MSTNKVAVVGLSFALTAVSKSKIDVTVSHCKETGWGISTIPDKFPVRLGAGEEKQSVGLLRAGLGLALLITTVKLLVKG